MRTLLTHIFELNNTTNITTAGVTSITIGGGTIQSPQQAVKTIAFWNGMTPAQYSGALMAALQTVPDVYAVTANDNGTVRTIVVSRVVEVNEITNLAPVNLAIAVASPAASLVLRQTELSKFALPEVAVQQTSTSEKLMWGAGGILIGSILKG